MKRRIAHLLARLYPAAWRERYGEEFDALVEDSRPGFRGLFDIARGALAMQLQSPPNLARAAMWFGLAGLLAALPINLLWRDTFVSVGAMEAPSNPEAVAIATQSALRGDTLAELVQRHKLYPDEVPKQELIERMQKRIKITGLTSLRGVPGKSAFRVGFAHQDPAKARAVTRELMALMTDEYLKQNPSASGLEVLDSPSLPREPVSPNRPVIFFMLVVGGAMLGTWIAMIRRDGPLRVLRFAVAGGAIGASILAVGVMSRPQPRAPSAEAFIEAKRGRPPVPELPENTLAELAQRYHFENAAEMRSHLSVSRLYAESRSRARIVCTHQDPRVAVAILSDILPALPDWNVLMAPAVTSLPSYPSSRVVNISTGAFLGAALALICAAIWRPRVLQPAV